MSKASSRSRAAETTAHVDLEYPSSVPTFTVNPTSLSSSSSSPLPWFSAFGRKDNSAPLPSEIDPKYSDPAYYASASTYGKNGRNSSHTAKKPEGHIKRPPNCFLLFRSHVKESGIRIPDALKPILKDRLKEKRREQKARRSGGDDGDEDDEEEEDDNDDDEQSVSKISGILWDFLPAAEKSFFRARAAHAKSMHKKLYPNYKYSPQVKDKSVKRRVGKKMPSEKRARLEEVATVLVKEMGWAEGEISIKQRSATPSTKTEPQPDPNVPGMSAFGVPGYAHDKPARMERRTSSCPPPNANLTWADAAAAAASGHPHTPPASYGQTYTVPPPQHQWSYPPPISQPQPVFNQPPVGHSFVRPGGKTLRKMRTGPNSAKAQALNGSGKKSRSTGETASHLSSGGMTLPSLPAVMKATSTEVPMTTGTASHQQFEAPAPLSLDGSVWTMGGQYDQSQHSSPQTFSSSAPPSVLLETPPFHPQMHYQAPAFDQSAFDFPGAQTQPFEGYQLHPMPPPQQAYTYAALPPAPEATGKPDEGELGLTIIDQHYTFPPTAPSPTGSPRSGSPPKAPSQRERSSRNRPHHHSPLGTAEQRKVARLATRSPPRRADTNEEPYTPSSASTAAPPLLSPTPVTPISSMSLHHQAQPQQYDCSVDDLGVDLNISLHQGTHGEIEVDASMLGGFQFPATYGDGGFGLLGGANAHVLLGDVALGMHDGEDQQFSQYGQFAPIGPLDVPLQALYGGEEAHGPVLENFDPATYIADDLNAAATVDEMKMASSQQLEYEMMEWRRGSGGSTATIRPGPQQHDDGRRASVSLGMALGSEVGMALYGFDAATSSTPSDATPRAYEATGYGIQAMGGDFDFHQAQNQHYQHMHPQHEFAMYPASALGTVPEERSSSEEAADLQRRPALHNNGSWVASSA